MAILIMTALAGTGFGISLLLLWFSWGSQQFVYTSVLYVLVTGVITVAGLVTLKFTKPREDEEQNEV